MAPRGKFVLNKPAIGRIAKRDRGIKAALHKIAGPAATKAGGHVEEYETDRSVAAVVVGEEDQAANGAGTKAMGESGLRLH